MEQVYAEFAVIKAGENTFDVVIMGEASMLQAFAKVYDKLFYIEESIFDKKPAVIAPDFASGQHAETWKEYWAQAFADPDHSCESCPTVKRLLGLIEEARQEKT
jgi:hypothetical protein